MITFIIRRCLQALVSVFAGTLFLHTFFTYITPNSAYTQYQRLLSQIVQPSGPVVPEGQPPTYYEDSLAYYEEVYKLDKPWPLNFLLWLFDPSATTQLVTGETVAKLVPKGIDWNILGLHITGSGLLTGDSGTTTVSIRSSFGTLIADRWSNTLILLAVSLAVALLISIPVGIISAVRHNSAVDIGITFVTFIGISMPPFMLAFVLSAFFGILPYNLRQQYGWDWLPMLQPGYVFSTDQEGNWINRVYHMMLPVATLALAQGALFTRHVRSSMLEVLRQDYIRTALAKGASVSSIVVKHAFRNALIPLITVVSLAFPTIISGSMIIEQVFSYPGMGQLFFKSVQGCRPASTSMAQSYCPPFSYAPDFTITIGLILIMLVVVVVSSLLADILYVVVDPRISLDGRSK